MTLSKSFKTSYKGQTLYEQALLLKTEDSTYTLIAGCAHPGIDIMADAIKKDLGIEIKTVMGGFHLSHSKEEDIVSLTDNLKAIGIRRVAPTHCSGKKAKDIFRNAFEEEFISIYTGKEVEID
jgi:7,8-dihydropterin-6-yl-methyl-4-(beta-D-ribofuranosyl)aminobenzene 5'-phosphate synthase